jgi:hypothetical protein
MNTKSELLFESCCRIYGIQYQRVHETTEPRPDYELIIEGQQILAEIKQFDPNADEREAMERRARGEQVVWGSKPGERLRRAIRSANTQLRQLLAENHSIPSWHVCSISTAIGQASLLSRVIRRPTACRSTYRLRSSLLKSRWRSSGVLRHKPMQRPLS